MSKVIHAKVTEIYESNLFNSDADFENEDLKDSYYQGDFWYDCDYILVKGKTINCVEVDGEIILQNYNDIELSDNQIELIEKFYSNPFDGKNLEELSTWRQDIEESKKRMNDASLAIKYRGGKGYYYGWWILQK